MSILYALNELMILTVVPPTASLMTERIPGFKNQRELPKM
jgi:hypothetical protein